MLIIGQPSILVTPNKIAEPHFKSSGHEPNVTLHRSLLYGAELLIFICTPIKAEVPVVHLIPLFLCVLQEHNPCSICHEGSWREGEWLVPMHCRVWKRDKGFFATCWTSPRAKWRVSQDLFPSRGLGRGQERTQTWHSRLWKSRFNSAEKGVHVCDVHKRETPKQKEGKKVRKEGRKGIQGCLLEEEGGSPFSKPVDLSSSTIGQWGGAFDRSPNDLPNSDGMQGWSPHYAVFS